MQKAIETYTKSENISKEYTERMDKFLTRYTNSKTTKSMCHDNFKFQSDLLIFIDEIIHLEDEFSKKIIIYEITKRKYQYSRLKDIGNFFFICLINSIVIISTVSFSGKEYGEIASVFISFVLIFIGYKYLKLMEYPKAEFYNYLLECINSPINL